MACAKAFLSAHDFGANDETVGMYARLITLPLWPKERIISSLRIGSNMRHVKKRAINQPMMRAQTK